MFTAADPGRPKGGFIYIVRFVPIGNADTCFIKLVNGRRALFDLADMHES